MNTKDEIERKIQYSHELGHAIIARAVGCYIDEITPNYTKFEIYNSEDMANCEEYIINSAGYHSEWCYCKFNSLNYICAHSAQDLIERYKIMEIYRYGKDWYILDEKIKEQLRQFFAKNEVQRFISIIIDNYKETSNISGKDFETYFSEHRNLFIIQCQDIINYLKKCFFSVAEIA